ncbi:hypothetical protein KY330_04505 [Candidatus Woesearchaeota archaeon]|nr:hypothetical protein [Candidatus Woesearchaeota archaeon]
MWETIEKIIEYSPLIALSLGASVSFYMIYRNIKSITYNKQKRAELGITQIYTALDQASEETKSNVLKALEGAHNIKPSPAIEEILNKHYLSRD